MAEPTRIRALGTLEIHVPGEGSSTLAQPRRTALLLYLAVATPAGAQSRDTLLGLFWPEASRARARSALNSAVHYLRQRSGAGAIVGGAGHLEIDTSLVMCDVREFEDALGSGDRERALSLYGGDLASGFHIDGSPSFERWLDERRSGLRRRARAAARELMQEAEAAAEPQTAAGWARRLVLISPDDEFAIRDAMRVLHRAGQPAEAQRVFEGLERYLAADFDMAPSDETVQLARELRGSRPPVRSPAPSRSPSSAAPPAAPPSSLRSPSSPAAGALSPPADGHAHPAEREARFAARSLPPGRRMVGLAVAVVLISLLGVVGIRARTATVAAGVGSAATPAASGAESAALAAFRMGEVAYREGRFRDAESEFRRAADLDTTLIVAALRYSQSANWTGNEPGVIWGLLRAQERSDGLAPLERLRLHGWQAYLEHQASGAERSFRAIIAEKPDDVDAWFMLGETQFHLDPDFGRSVTRSRAAWRRVLELDPGHAGAAIHLARVEASAGDHAAFEDAAARVLAAADINHRLEVAGLGAFAFGTAADRRAIERRVGAGEAAALHVIRGWFTHARSVERVEPLLRPLLVRARDHADERVRILLFAARVEAMLGRWVEAERWIDLASPLDPARPLETRAALRLVPGAPSVSAADDRRLSLLLERAALLDSTDPRARTRMIYLASRLARRAVEPVRAAELERGILSLPRPEQESTLPTTLAALLSAERAFLAGDHELTLARLPASGPVVDRAGSLSAGHFHAHTRWLRALSLAALDRTDEALAMLESFPHPDGYDLTYREPALRARAGLHASRGELARANELIGQADELVAGR